VDLQLDGVRINAVNPGPVNTDHWDTLEKAFATNGAHIAVDGAHCKAIMDS
jgi:NAD(P)-dependent dehydrogenase (short-subunit alcohol dehydrogenase family)